MLGPGPLGAPGPRCRIRVATVTTYCQASYLLSGKLSAVSEMHPKGIYMHPNVSIYLHPTTAYMHPTVSAYMHPKGAYMHPRVAAYMHPRVSNA